jgi:adenylate kinase
MPPFQCTTILLLGPTGSGKTPLGDALAAAGCNGRRTAHFDFGAHLRAAVTTPEHYPLMAPADVTLLKQKLLDNALLEDHEFYIAERILGSFITTRNLDSDSCLILNGLPRHTGQAEALEALLSVSQVIYLECSPEVVLHRIHANTGGDRSERTDDSPAEIQRKLTIFTERTAPLCDFYRSRNIPVRTIRIEPGMSTETVLSMSRFVK